MMLDEVREGRRERKSREMRRKILEAALELFTTRGFAAVTMEDIAREADVARGTVFNYFAGKDVLCQGLGELQVEQIREEIAEGVTAGMSAAARIEWLMRRLAHLPGQDPQHCRSLLTRALATMQPGEVPEHKRQLFQIFEEWAEEGRRDGEFRADLPAQEIACFLMGLHFQAVVSWAYGFTPRSLPDHMSHVLHLTLEGVRTRSHSR